MRQTKAGIAHPFYGVTPSRGLHELRNKWVQRTYLAEQCEALIRELPSAIQATNSDAPCRSERGKTFRIHAPSNGVRAEHDAMHESSKERRLERRIYEAYQPSRGDTANALWHQLVAFQVPLAERQQSRGWGKIDLLALTADGHPIIVELKTDESTETPLRAILEGMANAVAVAKNWSYLSREILASLSAHGRSALVASGLVIPRTLVLAPDQYWKRWEEGGAEARREVTPESRAAVRALRRAAADQQFPVDLGVLTETSDKISLRRAEVDW